MRGTERTTMAQPCKNSKDAPHTKEVRTFRLQEDKDAQETALGARRKHRIQDDDPSRYESVECTSTAMSSWPQDSGMPCFRALDGSG